MEVKVRIITPDGMAFKLEPKLRTVLMPMGAKSRCDICDGHTIHWFVDCSIKQALKLNKNVALFDTMMINVFNNKHVSKLIKASIDKPEDYAILQELFKHHTKVTIVKHDEEM